nr:tetratricopeptide repeat protein [Pedobacter cryophilus]
MKNVTAHYNIYFNANELLKESEQTIKKSLEDDFNLILAIFPIPNEESSANETGNLNEVIKKANTIAIDKYESNWLDDSYLLLAKAEYLKGDFYNAVEYYSYVGSTFPKEKKNKLAAYLGQVKSDFALNNAVEADSVLKLAVQLDYKYFKDEVEAAQAQLALNKNDIKEAILHLEKAVNLTRNSYNKIRWRYILAQLQELNNEPDEAYKNYLKIAKSNASFEMSFNANLASIRINENADGKQFNKIATLKKLLKEDKNREFKEQIYYQIAIAHSEIRQFDKATEYFQTSAHTVPGTVKQKGLSFLKLAQLNFDSLKNYTQAQLYYDSTLQYLPKNYPDYKNIAIKANNLKYLADRLTIIETQKNLLQLANLSDKEIDEKVDQLFKEKQDALVAQPTPSNTASIDNNTPVLNPNQSGGNFYFYNAAALSQGLNEFKKRWGNRKLADNWRISTNSLANDVAKNPINNGLANTAATISVNMDSLKADFLKTLPYSPGAKQSANSKISTALYEIAIFYKDVLKDNFEAAEALEALIINYPNDTNAASIYYQLYRLLESTDKNRSENFKTQLLQKYPNSVFAKTISDPNFGKDEELSDEKVKLYYTSLYELYQQKKYNQVLQQITLLQDSLGSFRKLEPQFAYLKALALGNTQKLPPFLASLNDIVIKYPENTEVTPLVKQQIAFITSNRSVFDQRPTALLAYDGNEQLAKNQEILNIPKVEQPQPSTVAPPKVETIKEVNDKPVLAVANKPVELVSEKKEAKKELDDKPVLAVTNKSVEIVPEKKEAVVFVPEKPKGIIFNANTRQRHFIVIDITDPKVNVAQPFSRLSQYFYSKFDPSKVNLVIRVVGQTDKFIIVSGDFYAKADADKIASELDENLPKIMEGQAAKYIKFVVSETNLNLLTTREAIEQYVKSISEKK